MQRASGTAGWGWVVVALALGLGGLLGREWTPRPVPVAAPWPSYADVFQRVVPTVVNVSVEADPDRIGTGFSIGGSEVVTARHLVVGAERVIVREVSGVERSAIVVGADARTDLALLRTEGGGMISAPLGTSEPLRVGDTVVAIGNPYGLGHTLSVGVVGQRSKLTETAEGPRIAFLQLSMSLNPGNSGGPVFGADGSVVAVLTGTHSTGQGIAFAVPVEALRTALPLLRAGEQVSRAFFGASIGSEGVVEGLVPSGPADKAGVRAGDQLVALAGQEVRTAAALQARLDGLRGGQQVSVRLLRDGAPMVVDATLSDWAEQPVVIGGMTLKARAGTGGEVVAIRPRSRAEIGGVVVGDVIRAIDGHPARAPSDVKEAMVRRGAVVLEVERGGMAVAVRLEVLEGG